jgi:hypothetical protein
MRCKLRWLVGRDTAGKQFQVAPRHFAAFRQSARGRDHFEAVRSTREEAICPERLLTPSGSQLASVLCRYVGRGQLV